MEQFQTDKLGQKQKHPKIIKKNVLNLTTNFRTLRAELHSVGAVGLTFLLQGNLISGIIACAGASEQCLGEVNRGIRAFRNSHSLIFSPSLGVRTT